MRTKLKLTRPEVALTRILEALGQELLDASEEEIMAAAKDLGMDPTMRGSAAFAGLKYPATPQLSDFFDLDACRKLQNATSLVTGASKTVPKRKVRRPRRAEFSTEGKDTGDK